MVARGREGSHTEAWSGGAQEPQMIRGESHMETGRGATLLDLSWKWGTVQDSTEEAAREDATMIGRWVTFETKSKTD